MTLAPGRKLPPPGSRVTKPLPSKVRRRRSAVLADRSTTRAASLRLMEPSVQTALRRASASRLFGWKNQLPLPDLLSSGLHHHVLPLSKNHFSPNGKSFLKFAGSSSYKTLWFLKWGRACFHHVNSRRSPCHVVASGFYLVAVFNRRKTWKPSISSLPQSRTWAATRCAEATPGPSIQHPNSISGSVRRASPATRPRCPNGQERHYLGMVGQAP